MLEFNVEITEKIQKFGEQDAEMLRRRYPQTSFDTEIVVRCKAICKAAMAHYTNKQGRPYLNLEVSDIYGKTDEEIQAVIDRKVGINKRSAGAKALSAKYGKDAAEKIIQKHTGHHYSLQS
jgi:hypothetical protein